MHIRCVSYREDVCMHTWFPWRVIDGKGTSRARIVARSRISSRVGEAPTRTFATWRASGGAATLSLNKVEIFHTRSCRGIPRICQVNLCTVIGAPIRGWPRILAHQDLVDVDFDAIRCHCELDGTDFTTCQRKCCVCAAPRVSVAIH